MGVSVATITGSESPLRVGMTPGVLPLAVRSLTQRATRRSYVCGSMERATRAGGSADIWSEQPPAPVAGVLPRLLPAVALPGWGGVLAKGGAWTERALGFGCTLFLYRLGQVCGYPHSIVPWLGGGGCVTRWVPAALAQARTSSRPRVFRLPYAPSLSCTPWLHLQLHLPPWS